MHEIPELAERLNAISTERAIVPAPTKEPILSVHQIDISYEFKKLTGLRRKLGYLLCVTLVSLSDPVKLMRWWGNQEAENLRLPVVSQALFHLPPGKSHSKAVA